MSIVISMSLMDPQGRSLMIIGREGNLSFSNLG